MLNITTGIIPRAQKIVIYGAEGVGKTSLSAKFPDPVIIDTEGGTSHMDVRRIGRPESWEELLQIVKEIAATPGICRTLVIDTADWAEQLIVAYLCRKYKQNSIESFGYGKGYTYMGEEFAILLSLCDVVIRAGIHVVITAHAKMRKFEQPDEMGAYDRWEMKLSKQVAPLLKEWCDMLLFCNYQTFVVTSENNTQKAQGGKRVMYTSHHPCWDAKNRIELPEIMDLDYKNIAHAVEGAQEKHPDIPAPEAEPGGAKESPLDAVKRRLGETGITEEELVRFVAEKGHYPSDAALADYHEEFLTKWVLAHWEKIVANITASRGLPD